MSLSENRCPLLRDMRQNQRADVRSSGFAAGLGRQAAKRPSACCGRIAITAPAAANYCRASTRGSGIETQPAVPVVGERQTWMKMQEPARARPSVG